MGRVVFVFHKLKKPLIYEKIIEEIKTMVISGELKPGDRLPSERAMTEMFGISRMSLREALKALSVLGLLEAQPGEGYFVSKDYDRGLSSLNLMSFYLEDVRFSVLETRLIIEPEAVKLAVHRITPEQLEKLEECVTEMLHCVQEGRSYTEPDECFHRMIYEATHNVVLINMMKTLGQIIVPLPVGKERSALDHKEILAAIKEQDGEKASHLMTEHLVATRENFLKEIHQKVMNEKLALEM